MSERCFRQHPWLLAVGILISVLLSMWACYIDGIINNDGVHYILTAEHIAAGEWREAFETFKWPAYSFLIYLTQQLPGLDYAAAAHVVTGAGFTLAVLAFVRVVHALGGRGRVLWLALATVLAYPGFNEFRSLMIRDTVFLAFYLFALSELLWFVSTRRRLRLALAIVCLAVATLFRVEALALALLLPGILAISGQLEKRQTIAAALYVLAVAPLLALFYGWWVYRPGDNGDVSSSLVAPWSVFGGAMEQVFGEFSERLQASGHGYDLGGVLAGFATAVWLVIRESAEAVTIPYAGILLYEAVRGRIGRDWLPAMRRVLVWLLLLHVVVLVIFALAKFFLAPRYPLAFATTLILAVPFALDRYLATLVRMNSRLRRYAAATGLALLMVINTVEGLDNVTEKRYLRDAAYWLRDHAAEDYRLASNDLKFVFYAGRYDEKWVAFREDDEFREFLESDQWKWKDYVAVNVRHREPELESAAIEALGQDPVKRFVSGNGDRLLIFFTGDE